MAYQHTTNVFSTAKGLVSQLYCLPNHGFGTYFTLCPDVSNDEKVLQNKNWPLVTVKELNMCLRGWYQVHTNGP